MVTVVVDCILIEEQVTICFYVRLVFPAQFIVRVNNVTGYQNCLEKWLFMDPFFYFYFLHFVFTFLFFLLTLVRSSCDNLWPPTNHQQPGHLK